MDIMITIIETYFKSLLSPACIIDKSQKIIRSNKEFSKLVQFKDSSCEGMMLIKCINIDTISKNENLFHKAVSNYKIIKRKKLKGCNSNGNHLSLDIGIVPCNRFEDKSELVILIFTDQTSKEIIQKKYIKLYEKEKKERKKIEEFNTRLNELVNNKTKELKKTHEELEKTYTSINNELEIAKSVQCGLLPHKLPDFTNIDVATTYIPTGKVGGDMYDIIPLSEDKTAIFIFDVSGHGVPSALIAAMAKMLFTHHIKKYDRPSDIFTAINNDICNSIKTGHYLTSFLGIIDHTKNTMVYSQAGHVFPIVYSHKNHKTTFIHGNSVFVGHISLKDIAVYHDNTISLDWNDKLILYTDGLTEAFNPSGKIFGTKQLSEIIAQHGEQNTETLNTIIIEENKAFRKGLSLQDDLTLLSVQIGCSKEILSTSGFRENERPEMLALNSHDDIEEICATILKKMDRKGYSDKEIFQTHQSIHEILANAIRHGNKFNSDKKVFVLYKILLSSFTISVIDEGKGFNYFKLPTQLLPENIEKEHGKGLIVVREYMDEMEFNQKGNRIMIRKHQMQVA